MVSKGVVKILPSLSRNSTVTVSTRMLFARKVTRKKIYPYTYLHKCAQGKRGLECIFSRAMKLEKVYEKPAE